MPPLIRSQCLINSQLAKRSTTKLTAFGVANIIVCTAALLEVRYPARCSPGLQRRAHGCAWPPQTSFHRAKGRMKPKYIFVTGGVVFSLGKGVAASSIGCFLLNRGFKVTLQKYAPYLNT